MNQHNPSPPSQLDPPPVNPANTSTLNLACAAHVSVTAGPTVRLSHQPQPAGYRAASLSAPG